MKYRLLTDEELKELEEDFKHFLITNHVYNEEWIQLNKTNDKKVKELVELFSDIVFEKALSKIIFLESVNSRNRKSISDTRPRMPGTFTIFL